MSKSRDIKKGALNPRVAWKELQDAIEAAPLKGLRDIIRDEVQSDPFQLLKQVRQATPESRQDQFLQSALDDVQDCMMLSMLGDRQALEALLNLSLWIADFTRQMFSGETMDCLFTAERFASTTKEEIHAGNENEPQGNWRQSIGVAASKLEECEEEFLEDILGEFDAEERAGEGLDYSPDTISWRQAQADENPDECLARRKKELVHKICGFLIQKRFIDERVKIVHDVAARSTAWPVRITLLDFHRGHLSRKNGNPPDYFPPTELGAKWNLNLKTFQGRDNTPATDALSIYGRLNKQRSPLRPGYVGDDIQEWEKRERKRLRTQLNRKLKTAERLHARLGLKKSKGQAPNEPDEDRSALKECCHELEVNWMSMAALLPDLDKDTINLWADAAFSYVAAERRGDMILHPWPEGLKERLNSRGKATASAIKEYFREGFKSLVPQQK